MKNFIEFEEHNTYNSLFVRKEMISWIDHDEETGACLVHVWPDKTLSVCEDLNYILRQLGEIE